MVVGKNKKLYLVMLVTLVGRLGGEKKRRKGFFFLNNLRDCHTMGK